VVTYIAACHAANALHCTRTDLHCTRRHAIFPAWLGAAHLVDRRARFGALLLCCARDCCACAHNTAFSLDGGISVIDGIIIYHIDKAALGMTVSWRTIDVACGGVKNRSDDDNEQF